MSCFPYRIRSGPIRYLLSVPLAEVGCPRPLSAIAIPWRHRRTGRLHGFDLDLRKVRYFVAVAGKLHFGRAAEELHIAQPVLSRQIRALEQDLGTPLLTRDSHGVMLTDA